MKQENYSESVTKIEDLKQVITYTDEENMNAEKNQKKCGASFEAINNRFHLDDTHTLEVRKYLLMLMKRVADMREKIQQVIIPVGRRKFHNKY